MPGSLHEVSLVGRARQQQRTTGEAVALFGETRYAARRWSHRRRVIMKAEVVLQDGGVLVSGIARELGGEDWPRLAAEMFLTAPGEACGRCARRRAARSPGGSRPR